MPKTLTQHQIRQRAVQVLFSYAVQKEMATNVVSSFRENVEKYCSAVAFSGRFLKNSRTFRATGSSSSSIWNKRINFKFAMTPTNKFVASYSFIVLNYDNDRPEDLEAPEYFTQLVDGVLDKKEEQIKLSVTSLLILF